MDQIITDSDKKTQDFAEKVAKGEKYKVIGLVGDLGAGKTTFVQGFAQGLDIKDKIISPTFVLVRQHKIPNSKGTLFHIDLYRLEGEIDIKQIGLDEMWSDSENIVIIEWAEKIKDKLPKDTIFIEFEKLDDMRRQINIKKPF